MKKNLLLKIQLLFLLLTTTCLLHAQSSSDIVWNFGTTDGLTTSPPPTNPLSDAVSITENITQKNYYSAISLISTNVPSSGYTGASGGGNAEMAVTTQADFNVNTSAYFEITLTPAANTTLTINSISFGSRSTGTGPKAYSIRTSIDGFASDAAANTLQNNSSWALISPNLLNISSTGAITIRIYAYGGTGGNSSAANWRIDDLDINVSTTKTSAEGLPIKFVSFTVKKNDYSNELMWQTASEFNVNYFDIESSGDGIDFHSIGQMPAKNSSAGTTYSYTDKEITATEYYRIASVDLDGTKNYSPIVFVQNDKAMPVKFQNTVAKNNLQFISDELGIMHFVITNTAGQIIMHANMSVSTGNNIINVGNLPKGIYFFKANFNNVVYQFKFLKD